MHQTKLIRLLKTFSAWEIRAFDDFVRSSFFNKNHSVTRLWQLTKEFAPAFDQPELERKLVFTVIFPEESFDEQNSRYLMTDLTRLIENFWCISTGRIIPFGFNRISQKFSRKGTSPKTGKNLPQNSGNAQ
ncbi:MAG: hypothetical protein R3C61_29160 [Bacteroidia bacterium]